MNNFDVDQFGLPTGPLRRDLIEYVLRTVDQESELEGWDRPAKLYLVRTDFAEGEGSLTLSQSRELRGNPLEAMWGMDVPSDAAALVMRLEGWTAPDHNSQERQEIRLVVMVTRAGDAWEIRRVRGQEPQSSDDPPYSPAVRMLLRAAAGLPYEGPEVGPASLLATWAVQQSLTAAEKVMWPTADMPEEVQSMDDEARHDEVGSAAILTAAIAMSRACLDDPTRTDEKVGVQLEKFLAQARRLDKTTYGRIVRAARGMAERVTWSDLVGTELEALLPAHLRDPENLAWGDGLVGWWMQNQYFDTPRDALKGLEMAHSRAAATVAEMLVDAGWMDRPHVD